MNDPVPALVLDLLEWLCKTPRPYSEVMETWRTSCPRLPVWETANERGFIEHIHAPGEPARVGVSARGREHLAAHRARGKALPEQLAPRPAPELAQDSGG